MKTRWIILSSILMVAAPATWAQAPVLPPGEKEPLVRLEAGGPTSFVTALTFSPDGKLLYAGGLDKVVRVWSLNEQGQFVSFPATYRVPIGPGLDGAINCIALSPDGTLLAVAGRGVFRQGAGFRQPGWVVPSIGAMNADMLRDQGMIYVFDTQTQAVRLLRGHQGAVLSMTFASADGQASPILVSAARERNEDANKYEGVVRAWNARTGEYLDGIREQPATDVRPGLTAWRTGKGIKDLGVGIAWGDGSLKVWNLGQGKPWSAEMDGEYNTALARLADSGNLLSGSIGRLRVWSYSPDTGLKAERAQATFASQDNVFLIPRAVAAAPSQVDQKPTHVAVVLRVFQEGTQDEYRLRLLDLDGLQGVAGSGDISLWKGRASQPVLAASWRGYLAVSGNNDHSIHIYSVQNLLQNQTKPQILHSVGAAFRYVSFVTKGKELGLLLRETAKKKLGQAPGEPLQGDQIFDFTKRPLTGDIREWQTAAPASNGWQARLAYADDQPVLPIYQGQGLIREIKLAKGMVVTDYALLSPRSPLDVPILAVAYHDLGQPWLVLYDGKTGEQIRQLTGHVDPISCLAFSPDGRLLASVAEDQTVCIWSLADLDRVLGKRGLLVGVAVNEQNDAVVVGKVHDDSPSRGQLAVGDVIEGIVANEKVRELKTSLDFYLAMAKMTPRSPVTLRLKGKAGARDVRLVVGQGVDERKPLFSLFVTQADREWIGWNPIGRFESSGPKAETYLGWHFNTGDADGPTRFALAQEYAKKYYQEGVLKDLIRLDQGEIKKLPPKPPPPAPKIGLLIDEEGSQPGEFLRPDSQGRLRLRHPRAALRISIIGRPVDTLKSVTWNMDQGAEQPIDLTQVAGQELVVEKLEFSRGSHHIRVSVKTPEGPTEYTETVTCRYQPPAPLVKYSGEKTILVKEPNFDLRALLSPGAANELVKVTILQKSKDKAVLNETRTYRIGSQKSLALSRPLKLEKGYNLVEVTAVNEGATGDGEEAETARLALEINYFKEAAPPSIALRGILPLADGAASSAEINIEPGRPIRVNVPSIRILGEIRGTEDEDLMDAKWGVGKDGVLKRLTTFQAMKRKLPIDELITLNPGTQTFRFVAKTATSTEEERSVAVDYQPQVPQVVTINSPANGQLLKGEDESMPIELQASFARAKNQEAFKAAVVVNGREETARFDLTSGTVGTKVPLKPGVNQLRVKLSNEWGSTSVSDEVTVRYLRPPTILSIRAEEPKEGVPFVNVEARVRSATPLIPKSVRVYVNESERKPQIDIPDKPGEGNVWTVRLTNIPLDADGTKPTTNQMTLRVSNEEAEAEKEGAAQVVYRPKQPPPTVEFTQPVSSVSVIRAEYKVQFQVESKTPLEQVKLVREKHEPISMDVAKAEAHPDGSFLLTAEVLLKLDVGPNTLRLEALNKGGVQSSQPLEINYIYRPVRVAVDNLIPVRPGAKESPVKPQPGGEMAFDPQEEGRLRLRGGVLWDEADDQRLAAAKVVRVYVNGFQQLPAVLKKPGDNPRERSFQTNLVLNRDKGNHIEVALPDLAKVFNKNQFDFNVDCRKPERSQRLHLLIVSIQDKDPKLLETQILNAFKGNGGGTSQAVKAFDPIYSYPTLVDYRVKPSYVYYQLVEIKNNIQKLAQIGASSSDVVAVYYRGGEAVNAQGNLFQTSLSRPGKESRESAITCDEVVGIFAETPGAQILLMDVDRQQTPAGQDQISNWKDHYSRVGMLHYAWLGQTNAPKNPGLIQAIEQAMGQSTRLVEVRDGVERIASASPDFQKKILIYKTYLPKDLEDLTVR